MPRVQVEGFIGPANAQPSITLDCERTYNLYVQPVAPGLSHGQAAFLLRPALVPFATMPGQTQIRALFEENGRAFAVGSTGYAEVFVDATFDTVHPVENDGRPACIITNGSAGDQNMVISGGLGYVHDLGTDAFTQITDPDYPGFVHQADFFDGYGVVWDGGGSRQFSWSALEDFSTWDPLDVAERSTASDNLNGILRLQRTLCLFGRRTMEPWYDTGDPSTILAPTGSVLVEQGLYATFTMVRADNTILWLGVNMDGQLMVYRLDGMTPKRISTFAVEQALRRQDTPTDAVAYALQIDGHYYYVLVLPRQDDASFVYDISLDRWYQWGHWDPLACVWLPFDRAWVHCLAFEKHLVGDRHSGTIYELKTDVYADTLAADTL